MKILEQLSNYKTSNSIAMKSKEKSITFKELWEKSDQLGKYIKAVYGNCNGDVQLGTAMDEAGWGALGGGGESKTPIIVFGHKHPFMLVAFLACVKTGRAYVPIDINVPRSRVELIIDSISPDLIITTEEFETYKNYCQINIVTENYNNNFVSLTEEDYVTSDDVFYIIFTSGSTGTPKGVQITYSALNHFVEWSLTLGNVNKEQKVFINQAPFSFDLSVMDLYTSLASQGCLYALNKDAQNDYKTLFQELSLSNANIWVSTPSFADFCIAEPAFNEKLLPDMELFLFCGETLSNKTAESLRKRFPNSRICNTYGPTESTVAVTEVLIDDMILSQYNPLPIGRAKPGTMIKIMDGESESAPGEKGEIVIIGNTVSAGYFHNDNENKRAFFKYWCEGEEHTAYRTGDKGYFKDGMLFYCGRIDLQIKLHGYRIELEDVEENLMKISMITKAAVVPVYEGCKVRYLKAFCVCRENAAKTLITQKALKEELRLIIPGYMIPKKFVIVEALPMTGNGKVNRKRLQEI